LNDMFGTVREGTRGRITHAEADLS
jgi:hypothetical protein